MGNGRTLASSESIWKELVRDAKERDCFFDADDDKDLAKAILEVKKEYNQLDDLLNGDSVLFKSARWKVSPISSSCTVSILLLKISCFISFSC